MAASASATGVLAGSRPPGTVRRLSPVSPGFSATVTSAPDRRPAWRQAEVPAPGRLLLFLPLAGDSGLAQEATGLPAGQRRRRAVALVGQAAGEFAEVFFKLGFLHRLDRRDCPAVLDHRVGQEAGRRILGDRRQFPCPLQVFGFAPLRRARGASRARGSGVPMLSGSWPWRRASFRGHRLPPAGRARIEVDQPRRGSGLRARPFRG